jgi:ribosomal protein L37AE/L43A
MNRLEELSVQESKKICVECGEEIIERYESLHIECERCLNNEED